MEFGRPASKKLRLSSETSNRHSSDRNACHSKSINNNDDPWDEDGFEIDENVMQQIETQGFSQYHHDNADRPHSISHSQIQVHDTQPVIKDETRLRAELDTKIGEVTNLRRLLESRAKDYDNEIRSREITIAELKKQLIGKQSEIDFQKMEKMSFISKTPKSSKVGRISTQSANSSFHERFASPSSQSLKRTKVFNFGPDLHRGDILYKLLLPSLTLSLEIDTLNANQRGSNGIRLTGNEFTTPLESCLLQLCRFHSFECDGARNLLRSIVIGSNAVLILFHDSLSRKELRQDITNRKSKTIILSKMIDATDFFDECSLLKNTELYEREKGVSVRQVLSVLAKLLQTEPTVASMLVENEKHSEASCDCVSRNKRTESRVANSVVTSIVRFDSKTETNAVLFDNTDNGHSSSEQFVFDVVELLHDIVQEITVRDKRNKYEGVFSSIVLLFSALCCNGGTKIYEKQLVLIVHTIKKILFSLPGFNTIYYIVEFLNVTTQMNFSYSLCSRSDTCILQVLCAYIEMTEKTWRFVNIFTSWISTLTSVSHHLSWIRNTTDPKFCECLPMLEQNTVKMTLWCAERLNSAELPDNETTTLQSSLRRSVCVLQQFRCQDADFDLHIATCRGEYKRILKYLQDVDDDIIHEYVIRESNASHDNKSYNLTPKTRNELNKSMLKLFSQDS